MGSGDFPQKKQEPCYKIREVGVNANGQKKMSAVIYFSLFQTLKILPSFFGVLIEDF